MPHEAGSSPGLGEVGGGGFGPSDVGGNRDGPGGDFFARRENRDRTPGLDQDRNTNFRNSPQFQELLSMIQQRRAAAFTNLPAQQPRQPLAPLQLGPVPPTALPPQAAPQAAAQFPQINPAIAAFLQSLIGGQGQPAAPPFNFGQLISGG